MIENGFSIKKTAKYLNIVDLEVKNYCLLNDIKLKKETFDESKIDLICNLYYDGVSAKSLGLKYSIYKRRIQKWANNRKILRNKSSSHRVTNFNENIFDIIDSEEKAYWLGFFYADAYNCDISNTFTISLKEEDYNHLIKLANFVGLPSEKVIKYNAKINSKQYPSCTIRLYSKYFCEQMIKLGAPRAKSFNIKFPFWLDKSLYFHFIRGLFDGDGCLTYRKKYKEYKWSIVGTKEICEYIKDIYKEKNIDLNYYLISKTGNNTYNLESGGNLKIEKICNLLYDGSKIYLDRKYNNYKILKKI